MPKKKKGKKKRKKTAFGTCMHEQLGKGKMKGKTKEERKKMFKDAVKACRSNNKKKEEKKKED